MNYVLTPEFRVSYPNVFKPRKNDLSGKDEYSLVALFKKGQDLSELQKVVLTAAQAKWGQDAKITKGPQGNYVLQIPGKAALALRLPFRDQGEREGDKGMPTGYEKGAIFINLKTTQKPGLVDQKNQDIIEESGFYAGCYARAAVNAFAYDNKGNRGISLGLQALQKVKEGDPLTSRVKPQDAFAPVEDDTTTVEDTSDLFG